MVITKEVRARWYGWWVLLLAHFMCNSLTGNDEEEGHLPSALGEVLQAVSAAKPKEFLNAVPSETFMVWQCSGVSCEICRLWCK